MILFLSLSTDKPQKPRPATEVPYPTEGPCTGVKIRPEDDFQAQITSHRPKTVFCVLAGVHRLKAPLVPKYGQKFLGEPGAVLNGTVEITSWGSSGKFWVASGQTQQSARGVDKCADGTDTCRYAEDVFIDDKRLNRVLSRSKLSPGEFYFDYGNDKIYLADDPSGHKVEASVSPGAFKNGADDVTIRDLVVEKFANNAASQGAIESREVTGWLVANVTSRLNHGRGITPGPGRVTDSRFIHNGHLGLGGQGDNRVIENNEIAHNNELRIHTEWEAGGVKLGASNGVILRNNYIHDNDGPGIWADESCRNLIFEGNRVENNTHPGIFHEISYEAIIRNNIVIGNGFGKPLWGWGAGIQIAASGSRRPNGIEIYGNTVTNNYNGISLVQQDRGESKYGPHITQNVYVHDNVVTMPSGRTGAYDDTGSGIYRRPIRFEKNTYYIPAPTEARWHWNDEASTWAEWQAAGNDRDGSSRQLDAS